jgi:hypothetical protein
MKPTKYHLRKEGRREEAKNLIDGVNLIKVHYTL